MSRRSLSHPAAGSVIPFSDVGTSRGSLSYPTIRSLIPFVGASVAFTHEPWLVNVHVFMTPISHVNWNSSFTGGGNIYAANRESSGAQNDEISFDVLLAAGTWTYEQVHLTSTARGIYSVRLDGVEKGTIDGYSSPSVSNVRSQIAGIAVATTGKVRLTLKMATKHASASNYYGTIMHIQFKRTA